MAVADFQLAGLQHNGNTTPINHEEEASDTEFQIFLFVSIVRFSSLSARPSEVPGNQNYLLMSFRIN